MFEFALLNVSTDHDGWIINLLGIDVGNWTGSLLYVCTGKCGHVELFYTGKSLKRAWRKLINGRNQLIVG